MIVTTMPNPARSTRDGNEPMAFTGREFLRGAIFAVLSFALLFPLATLLPGVTETMSGGAPPAVERTSSATHHHWLFRAGGFSVLCVRRCPARIPLRGFSDTSPTFGCTASHSSRSDCSAGYRGVRRDHAVSGDAQHRWHTHSSHSRRRLAQCGVRDGTSLVPVRSVRIHTRDLRGSTRMKTPKTEQWKTNCAIRSAMIRRCHVAAQSPERP